MMYLSQALSFSTFMACIFFLMASMLLLLLLLLTEKYVNYEKVNILAVRHGSIGAKLVIVPSSDLDIE